MGNALWVTFEGIDSCGKSTQIARLAKRWEAAGQRVLLTREPGGTALGQQLRQLVLHGQAMDSRTEALLFAADRAHHVASKVRPALDSGMHVLQDRYFDLSIAYQGAARQADPAQIERLNRWATGGQVPHATVFLDLPVAQARSRLDARAGLDRLEKEGDQFQQRVWEQYQRLIDQNPDRYLCVDATGSVEQVSQRVDQALAARFGATHPWLLAVGAGQ